MDLRNLKVMMIVAQRKNSKVYKFIIIRKTLSTYSMLSFYYKVLDQYLNNGSFTLLNWFAEGHSLLFEFSFLSGGFRLFAWLQ
jgi:hypothetical protein